MSFPTTPPLLSIHISSVWVAFSSSSLLLTLLCFLVTVEEMAVDERCSIDKRLRYDCLLFNLDGTLHPLSTGLAVACTENIGDYVVQKLGVDKNKVIEFCRETYKNYRTNMDGLRVVGYEFDYDNYHSIVHGKLPYEILKPNPVLKSLLLSMREIIFTNRDKVHAAKVLNRLGLEDCFEGDML